MCVLGGRLNRESSLIDTDASGRFHRTGGVMMDHAFFSGIVFFFFSFFLNRKQQLRRVVQQLLVSCQLFRGI